MNRRGVARWAAAVVVLVTAALASPAAAQDEGAPAVQGSVTGELARGREARVRTTVTHPGGWRMLDRVLVTVELHGVPLDEIDYGVGDGTISLGGARAVAGTGNALTGRFLQVNAFGVTVSTGGNRLELSFTVRVLRDVPGEATIRFVAEDDEGRTGAAGVPAIVPDEEEGTSATTVILAAAAALLAGGYLGARVATRRRPSVYETVARRIVDERGGRPRG